MTVSRARATRAIEVGVIDDIAGADRVAAEWAALADLAEVGPLSTPDFALAWWRHLGRGELRLVTVRNGAGDLVGIGPFHERRIGPVTVLRWLGHGLGTVGSLITAPTKADVAGAIWSTVAREGLVLELIEYRHGGAGLAELRHGESWIVHAELRDECPTIQVGELDSVADFLAVPERRGLRKQLAKLDRRLEASDSKLRTEVATTAEEFAAVLPAIDAITDAAERFRPRLHLLDGPYRPFLLDALSAAVRRGRLAVIVAFLDDHPIGFDVYVTSGSVVNAWLGRFDPVAAEWSPGHLLLRAGVEWVLDSGVATIDLQLGGDEYKLRWADGAYDTLGVIGATSEGRLRLGRAALGAIDGGYDVRRRMARLRPV